MVNGSGFSQNLGATSLPAALMISKHKRTPPQFLKLDQPSPAPDYLSSSIIEKYSLDKTKLPSYIIEESECGVFFQSLLLAHNVANLGTVVLKIFNYSQHDHLTLRPYFLP